MTNPLLAGIRVLDLSRLLPGPFCTLYLAQLGADVIKIEEPNGGDYTRTLSPELFAVVNRGKKSLTLDLRKPEDVQLFHRMVEQSDVVLESFRPGVMDKLGCGYETLKALNPRLVYAALTGYGQSGPYRDRPGHDMNYCGYAGVLDQTGLAGGPPVPSNFQIADLAGGALTCAVGILAAVIGAKASGQGSMVDVGMMDGTLALQVVSLATLRTLGKPAPRGQDMLSGGLPNYAIYECADGKHLALGSLESKFFQRACILAGRPDLLKKPLAPGKAGEGLRAELVALFMSKTRDEWDALLANDDSCASGILSPDEVLQNEQVQARGLVETTGGKPAYAMPIQFSTPRVAVSESPALGAHNEQVLAEFGLSRS
ncbi:CaiB/BaiF CoA transferase family protein [Nevskia soli]|uniref:CaiB/BaiF CoA transferase family protein n=1 Tax=Nevskia soli TaxID=418856 RepID=UPI0004A6CFEF|nr:CaiB/BaiF CoA-transferase family protein [Nevskia soli]